MRRMRERLSRWHRARVFALCVLFCLTFLTPAAGADAPAQEADQQPQTYPGLTEVIPKSTALSAKVTEAEVALEQAYSFAEIDKQFAEINQQLEKLESQFTDWDRAINWPLNRLMTAEARYQEVLRRQEQVFNTLHDQLAQIEDLLNTWTSEKEYWQGWQKNLRDNDIKAPQDVFAKTLQSIDGLLQKISNASTALVKKQEEYSASQELATSRMLLIENTLDELRRDTFRRNAYSLFSSDFYAQLTPALFKQYRENIRTTLELPDGFWHRHSWVIILQLVSIILLTVLMVVRKQKTKPISEEWRFLFKHPIAGALFITIALTGNLYENPPPSWVWLLLAVATVSGAVLVGAMTDKRRRKRLIRILAFLFLVSETLKITGLPTPAYQFYEVVLCALAIPTCLVLARHRQRQAQEQFGIYLAAMYVIIAATLVGLITALLGYVTLSTHLVDAVLGTIIIGFMVHIAIHLADGGITEFLRLNWIQQQKLTLRLGISTADRLRTLARIIILVNAGLFLLVMWGLYNDINEAATSLMSLEYTIGEFSLSVFMVVMVIVVLYLTNLISWLLQGMVDAYFMTPRNMDLGVKSAMKKLFHYALFTIGFFIAVSMAGLDLQKLTIIAGALSVGIGFGLQNIVNNFVSGLILLFERPVKVGDTINIDDQWGTITKIGLRSTVFETLDRSEIIVPNSDLISQKVVNWTFTTNISRVVLTVGVAYGSPLDKVLEILQRVADEHPDILDEPESSAIFTGFGDSSIDFELRAWIADISKRLKVKSELGQAIDRYFREADITIPFPQRDLHLRSIGSNLQTLLETQSQRPQTGSEETPE
ncbi:MAG: mechanosensitive ion channel [Desulfuromonadales bacterium]